MPAFRVVMEKRIAGERPKNPFLISDIFSVRWQGRVEVRQWEFEADNEAVVRDVLQQARDADIWTIRGFELVRIELIPE